ncbi:helix-turn-helix domain-containing protein [Streptomyces sp. NPDC017179]|uniref:helix-turn-helix domain-containing protein n=1 Tax=Streptomyces sp. NPDC017179 TaxID=3364979 RepID=UPI0037932509
MTAHGDSSGQDESEIANASTTSTSGRRWSTSSGRPGTRVKPRHRPAAPDVLPNGEVPPPAAAIDATGQHQHFVLRPVRLSLLDPPPQPAAVELADPYAGSLPRSWHLVFAPCGPLVVGALGRERRLVRLEPGSMMLGEPVRLTGSTAVGSDPARALVLHVPEAVLPLPGEVLHEVSGRSVPTGSGPAALLASFVHGLAAHASSAEGRHAAWLGTAAVSLAKAFLDSEAALLQDGSSQQPAPSAADKLLRDIKSHIEHHLHDPDLSPTSIAAAGHVSLRYLHHLFQRDGRTVGAFLRERRLGRCRADLSDPALAHRSVREIARRWGFRDAAVFNRTFKSAYGLTPGTYREQLLWPR